MPVKPDIHEPINTSNIFQHIAWPTTILQVTSQLCIVASWYYCVMGDLSLLSGCCINILAYYALFTPAHEAIHRSIFKNKSLNDIALYSIVAFYLPGSSGKFLRLMHLQHHRFTNEEIDPDHYIASNTRHIFFLWFFWDLYYIYAFNKNRKHYPHFSNYRLSAETTIGFGIIAAIGFFFPWETVTLWLIPTRVMMWLICFVFMYLPHVPHTYSQRTAPYKATSIRKGFNWLLTPLMMYQNYHLVHHLYPSIPFYSYVKAWHSKKAFHEAQDPAFVDAFSIVPHTQPPAFKDRTHTLNPEAHNN